MEIPAATPSSIANECYAVVRGCVRSFYIKEGIEKTTAFFTEGEPITAFSSYQHQQPVKHYVECTEDCLLMVGNQSLTDKIAELVPRLSEFLREEVEKAAGKLQERMDFFMLSTPEERYLNLQTVNPQLLNRVPQYQIASYLGITPESLSRIKKRTFAKR